ncbi:type III secretion system export apparatus subunit SctS [Pleionea sp. CnH1-48]|uniref:type III secretion system export apparatus subunit SctS n=1 Tax=Pleionea sp. CnH1-48 TaxID=2954494 RepID=UPI002096F569|nr:type III secretion system export apparatus subunit SctS [Pleionea sp. CnH1-48]
MNQAEIINFAVSALELVLILSLPPIIVASLVGILVSLFQAITQIQEQTIQFAIKLIVVTFTLLLTARWVGIELYNFSMRIFDSIHLIQADSMF